MMIERRWTTRAPVNIDVEVLYQDTGLTGYKARDIGLGGVFLEAHRDALPQGLRVELIFALGSEAQRIKHKIKAKVVRVTDHGLGLIFRDLDASTFRSLQEVLRHKDATPPPH